MSKIEEMIKILKGYNIELKEYKVQVEGNPQYQFYLVGHLYNYLLPLWLPHKKERGLEYGYKSLYDDIINPSFAYWFSVMKLTISNKCLEKIRNLENKNE